jgi:serine/threonine protein phosphatase PrpC
LGSSNASSTLVILLLKEGKAYMTHVGDSKIIYIDKTHHEWWVSKDHSLVQELFEAGILGSEREMKTHPLRNRITLSMNSDSLIAESEIKIDTLSKIHPGDIFMLCTDGVIENMTTDEIVKLCMEHPAETAFHQIRQYCQQNSKDNNTAIFIEI